MNATLRKLAASVTLFYADGSQAQTLVGTDFVLERKDQESRLFIDLSSNLLSRNKGFLCYYEAQGLLLQHAQLQSIRVNEKDLVLSLGRELKPKDPLGLQLILGKDQAFSYTTVPAITDRAVTFNIQHWRKNQSVQVLAAPLLTSGGILV